MPPLYHYCNQDDGFRSVVAAHRSSAMKAVIISSPKSERARTHTHMPFEDEGTVGEYTYAHEYWGLQRRCKGHGPVLH